LEPIVIADTDVVIDFFSGAEPGASIITNLIQGDRLALTSVTIFELFAGITGEKRLKQIRDLISAIPIFSLGRSEAEVGARIYNELKKGGNLIGNQDILIAGICIAHDIALFSKNTDHFSRISHLRLFSSQ
jgi:tRNA(fMet)-specific endonuclease VapC